MIVEIKQTPDQSASALGLEKYNRSKLPGVFEILQVARGIDGRWITGIDEESSTINSITDKAYRDKIKTETKKNREELERLFNTDLTATNNAFWERYTVALKDNETLNLANPQHKLKYHILIANGYAAPERASLSNPEYLYTKYYISRKEEETSDKVTISKQRDKAGAELLKIADNKFKLAIVGRYLLGDMIKEEMSVDSMYNEIRSFIDKKTEPGNVKMFLEVVSKKVEDLQYKLIFDKAIRKNIIRVRDGYYQRGNATYGRNSKEALDFLSSLENANEFMSLKDEVDGI